MHDSLVRVPATLLLHLHLPSVEDLFEVAQFPVRITLSPESTGSSIESLAK